MKLEPKAKPVRIRIKSGGEEHFNLESLKRNFSVQDLWEAVTGGSLSRWLRQQNESELAEKVDSFGQNDKLSIEDYIKFSSIFFEKETEDQPVENANALVRFYQDKELINNFRNALSFLLESMDYKEGKTWFDSSRYLKSNEDWIDFFTTKLSELEEQEKAECYGFLSMLHKDNNDSKMSEDCLSKQKELVIGLLKKDKKDVDKWLTLQDYNIIKAIFESEIQIKTNEEWIVIFENCKSQLSDADQAECFYYLASLYEKVGEKKKAGACMKKASELGFAKAIIKMRAISPRYPELTNILNHYRDGRTIAFGSLSSIMKDIKTIESKDIFYMVCGNCIKMFKETINDRFSEDAVGWDNLISRREILLDKFGESYELLIALVAALAWELKKQSLEMFEEEYFIEKYRNKFYESKRTNKKDIIHTSRGMECNLKEDSIIEQMFFCMETFGDAYSIKRKK